MSFDIIINGAFSIVPNVANNPKLIGNWQISFDGALLYLPEDSFSSNTFSTLKEMCKILKKAGHKVNGEARWIGEDESQGTIKIRNNKVTILSDIAESLSKAEIARLVEQIKIGDEAAKCEAINILDYFAVSNDSVLEIIAENLTNNSLKVRMKAADFLGNLGEKAITKVDDLIRALDDNESWMRAAAAEALGNLGKLAEKAIPHLEKLLQDSNYGPSGRAKESIEKIQLAKETGKISYKD